MFADVAGNDFLGGFFRFCYALFALLILTASIAIYLEWHAWQRMKEK